MVIIIVDNLKIQKSLLSTIDAGFLSLHHFGKGMEAGIDQGPELLILLLDHIGVLEVREQLGRALDASVADLADLV